MNQIIEHKGIISCIHGSHIQVLITQQSACGGCHARGACSAVGSAEKIIDVECHDPSLQVGQPVMLYGKSSAGLLAVLLAFVIPFVLILLALFVLRFFVENEVVSGLIALAVLLPYYVLLSLFNKKLKRRLTFRIGKCEEL